MNIIRLSTSLDPDQAQYFVEPDLDPNCIQKFSADDNSSYRHETFQIFGRFQIFSFQIIISKVVGFHLKVTKTQFWTGGVGVFRLFMACFRFFCAELSLMPVKLKS